MLKYRLHDTFDDYKGTYEEEHDQQVKRKLDDQKIIFKGLTYAPEV